MRLFTKNIPINFEKRLASSWLTFLLPFLLIFSKFIRRKRTRHWLNIMLDIEQSFKSAPRWENLSKTVNPAGFRASDPFPKVRGVFKKFAAQPRRKTNFTTKRGVRYVTLLKRPLTQPLANRSSCFAQAVGCCKNVFYFCRTQRCSAGSSDSIRSVTDKSRKGYPWILVGNTGGTLSSLQECQSEDWALQS